MRNKEQYLRTLSKGHRFLVGLLENSVADPHQNNADADADPGKNLNADADPDPNSYLTEL
jgi:hypothetical protein